MIASPFARIPAIIWRSAATGVVLLLLTLAALLEPIPAQAQSGTDFEGLWQQDLRLARIADGMLVANRDLCATLMPVTGLIMHSADQYGKDVPPGFAGSPLAVAGIVANSPADNAGLLARDNIAAIGERLVAELPREPGSMRDRAFDEIAAHALGTPLALDLVRDGRPISLTVQPQTGCRALVEVLAADARIARSDGRVIQLSHGLIASLSDENVAAILAHELGHLVLEHRRRLEEAGVAKGLFAEFGTNRRRNRQAEEEADRLSVHLLANAGYSPQAGPRLWLSAAGRKLDAGIFRSAIYPSPKRRAELMQEEIERFLPAAGQPSTAAHLVALREEPIR